MAAKPQCAVVIPTYNGAHLLSTCLAALLASPPERCDWRIVVVDDASSDRTVERFSAYDERVEVIAREHNGGFAEACNEGARAGADCDYLVFLNNDTVPLQGWLDVLVGEAEDHPGAAAFGSKLLYPDGTVQHAGIAIGHDRWPHHIYAGFPGDHPAVNRAKPVVATTAACMLVRRADFEGAGGFDTTFLNGYEDVDFCLRLGESGREVRYCPASVSYHLESVTRWADWDVREVEHNSRVYAKRWRDRIDPDDVEHYIADGLIALEYGDTFPVRMAISPLLATVQRETGPDDRLERLLSLRTDQVFELQAKRTRALLEHRRDEASMPSSTRSSARNGAAPKVIHEGETHRLGSGRPQYLVSALMPLKDAAAGLRQTLPVLFDQRVDVELEIVAVDSGSSDDTVDVLKEFGATVIAIDPADFDHGLTRNLAAEHARGDVCLFLNNRTLPRDDRWLASLLAPLDNDPAVAGVCSRVIPHPDADLLTQRDGALDPSGSPQRAVKKIEDWDAYRAMPVEQRRLMLNFHTVSAALRTEVLRRIPFQSVRAIGEDLLWAREVLEAGLTLVHEPNSCAYHSHDYSLRERFMRNVDDGIANRDINERSLSEEETDALIRGMIASDWHYLREEMGLEGSELEHWQMQAALRRTAQGAGQWLGVNHTELPRRGSRALLADRQRPPCHRPAGAMKVLLVCHGYPPYGVAGVERLSAQTAATLVARGHEVTVFTRRPTAAPPTLALERTARDGVAVVTATGGGRIFDQFPGHEPTMERIFERLLVEEDPDVVLATHLQHHSPGYVAIAQRWGVPVVLELHDFFALCPRAHLQRRSGELCDGPEGGAACALHCFPEQAESELRWALRAKSFAEAVRGADEVLVPSRYVATAFEPLRGEATEIQIVDNAVGDLGPVLRGPAGPPAPLHLASIGVTVEHKGFQVVIEALRRNRLPARYTVFGVALQPGAGMLHRVAEDAPHLELRLFGGFSPSHLPALLADADALVVPSLVPETYSIVVREAFVCGLPVIASRIGALPDAIRPGENGWLFEPGDASDLAALLQILNGDRDRLRRARVGARASDVTTVAARTDRIEQLLQGTVERARGRVGSGSDADTELKLMREALLRR